MFKGLMPAMPRLCVAGRAACSCDRGRAARRADFLQAPCLGAAAPLALRPPAATAPEYMQDRAGRPETGEAGGGEAGGGEAGGSWPARGRSRRRGPASAEQPGSRGVAGACATACVHQPSRGLHRVVGRRQLRVAAYHPTATVRQRRLRGLHAAVYAWCGGQR